MPYQAAEETAATLAAVLPAALALAVRRATATFLEPQQAQRRP